jgi:hypothetical protein
MNRIHAVQVCDPELFAIAQFGAGTTAMKVAMQLVNKKCFTILICPLAAVVLQLLFFHRAVGL